jgi:hypothetical protein
MQMESELNWAAIEALAAEELCCDDSGGCRVYIAIKGAKAMLNTRPALAGPAKRTRWVDYGGEGWARLAEDATAFTGLGVEVTVSASDHDAVCAELREANWRELRWNTRANELEQEAAELRAANETFKLCTENNLAALVAKHEAALAQRDEAIAKAIEKLEEGIANGLPQDGAIRALDLLRAAGKATGFGEAKIPAPAAAPSSQSSSSR